MIKLTCLSFYMLFSYIRKNGDNLLFPTQLGCFADLRRQLLPQQTEHLALCSASNVEKHRWVAAKCAKMHFLIS